jgi:hypothetical protein
MLKGLRTKLSTKVKCKLISRLPMILWQVRGLIAYNVCLLVAKQ